MPVYEYVCVACGSAVEVIHGINVAGPTVCIVCGGRMRKALSAPAIVFRGSGWAKKDARVAAASRSSRADAPSDGSDTGAASGGSDGGADKEAGSTDKEAGSADKQEGARERDSDGGDKEAGRRDRQSSQRADAHPPSSAGREATDGPRRRPAKDAPNTPAAKKTPAPTDD